MLEHTVQRLGKLSSRMKMVLAAVLLATVCLLGTVSARKEVTLVVDGAPRTVRTYRSTVAAFLKQEGIVIEDEDSIEPGLNCKLKNQDIVSLKRAVPVKLVVGGVTLETKSSAPTVGHVLMDHGIFVGGKDRLDPEATCPATAGQQITVVRIKETQTKTATKIPYSSQRRQDGNLEIGQTKLVQQGVDGSVERHLKRVYQDGELIHEEVLAETVTQEPVTEIVAVGTMGTVSRGGTDYRYSRAVDALATAYCPTDVGGCNTALGIKPKRGIVAVDPRVIPLGTRVYVENYGPALAADTGGAIKGNRVDIFVDSHQEAISWGRRKVTVYILK